jgi:hypothetical protein
MQTFDTSYIPRPKRCKECNHILGVVMRVQVNGSHPVRKLFVFYAPILVLPSIAVLTDIQRGMYKIHGLDSCDGIECSNCGALNSWYPSQEARDNLLRHFKTEVGIPMTKVKVMSNA